MLKPYDAYKDFDGKWIDKIPQEWEDKKIGELFIERKTKVSDKDYMPLSVCKAGTVPQLDTAVKSDNGDNRKLVLKGDYVINSRSDRRGSSGVSINDGSVSLINIVLEPRTSIVGRYSHYLLRSHYFIEEYYRNGRGIVADLWTTRYSEMRNIVLPVPTREEQFQIVRYLDIKLAKINKLIYAQKNQIVLLKEQKQAVINQAVTKGFDPNVKMKPSGIEWLGDIPVKWKVAPIKRIAKINPSIISILKKYSLDDDVVFLPMEKISTNGEIDNSEKRNLASVKSGFTSFARNDVVVAKITPCFENGKGACLEKLESEIGYGTTELIVLRTSKYILPKYLYLITKTGYFRILGASLMTGSAGQKRVPTDFIANFSLGIPDINEQKNIIEYCDKMLNRMDVLIDNIISEIKLVNEYRTRLISDVVTGKVDVRAVKVQEDSIVEEILEEDFESNDQNDDIELED